ncbi:MAG: hypothetical protein ACFNUL_00560 [Cardiobacterium hominis]
MSKGLDSKYIFEETMKTYDDGFVKKLFLMMLCFHLGIIAMLSVVLGISLYGITSFNIYLMVVALVFASAELGIIFKVCAYVYGIFRSEKRARQWVAAASTTEERKDRRKIFYCFRRRQQAELQYERKSSHKNKGKLESARTKWEHESTRFKERYFC